MIQLETDNLRANTADMLSKQQIYIQNAQAHVVTQSGVVGATYLHSLVLGRPVQDLQNQPHFTKYVLKHYQSEFTALTQALLAGKQALEDLELTGDNDEFEDQELFYKGRSPPQLSVRPHH